MGGDVDRARQRTPAPRGDRPARRPASRAPRPAATARRACRRDGRRRRPGSGRPSWSRRYCARLARSVALVAHDVHELGDLGQVLLLVAGHRELERAGPLAGEQLAGADERVGEPEAEDRGEVVAADVGDERAEEVERLGAEASGRDGRAGGAARSDRRWPARAAARSERVDVPADRLDDVRSGAAAGPAGRRRPSRSSRLSAWRRRSLEQVPAAPRR